MLKRAFTILELLIVVIIIGVLGTLGFVNYGTVRETSITKEARANLKLIAAAERIYRMEVGYFYPDAGGGTVVENDEADINDDLRLSLPEVTTRRWDYSVSSSGANVFTASAARNDGSGTPCTWTMNQGNTEANAPAAGCPQ